MKKFKIETEKNSKFSYRGERMSVKLGKAEIFIIQNDLGFVVDVYSRNKDNDFINSMQIWYEEVGYVRKRDQDFEKR